MMPKLFDKKDVLLVAIVVLVCAVMLVLQNSGASGKTATITVNSKTVATVDLRVDKTFTLPQAEGFEFEVKNGAIAVIKAPCSDKVCERSRYISRSGQTAVCLPYRLVVRIDGEDEFDA